MVQKFRGGVCRLTVIKFESRPKAFNIAVVLVELVRVTVSAWDMIRKNRVFS